MSQQERLTYLVQRCMDETATTPEREELTELLKNPENEGSLIDLINEALHKNDAKHHLPLEKQHAILNNILYATDDASIPTIKRRGSFWRYAAAAVLLAAVAGTTLLYMQRKPAPQEAQPALAAVKVAAPIEIKAGSDQAVLTLSDGKQVVLTGNNSEAVPSQGNTLVVNMNGQLVYNKNHNTPVEVNAPMLYNTVAVPRKGQYKMILSDGTKVWLNSESTLRYPVVFAGKDRSIELEGEGYFEIAKDPTKPFHVVAGNTDVMALGTHFNVMAYSNEHELRTSLLEGSVLVKNGNESTILKPGQQAGWSPNTKRFTITAPDMDEVVAWRDGYFMFNTRTSLQTVMHELERWYDIEVEFQGSVPHKSFGGGIQRTLPLSSVLTILQQSGIRFKQDGRKITVLQ